MSVHALQLFHSSDVVKLSCKSKIKGLSAGHKALTVGMFSVVCNSKREGEGRKERGNATGIKLLYKSIEGILSLPDIRP